MGCGCTVNVLKRAKDRKWKLDIDALNKLFLSEEVQDKKVGVKKEKIILFNSGFLWLLLVVMKQSDSCDK